MKRRNFLKTTAALGAAGLAGQGCSSIGKTSPAGEKFDVHPFIRRNPDAVFVYFTSVNDITDLDGARQAGYQLSKQVIVKSPDGYPLTAKVNIKPNWTGAGPQLQKGAPTEILTPNTDVNFVEGWTAGMKEAGPQNFFIRECCCPYQWEPRGWAAMCARNNIDLRDLSTMHVWTLKKGRDINFMKIPNGVMFKQMGHMAPMNEPGSFLVNIAKFRSHGMGMTLAIKNLQGINARRFHQFCTRYDTIRKAPRPAYEVQYHKYFTNDMENRIETLYAKHLKEGYPRWDRPGPDGGIWQETWVQRALDNLSVTKTALNMIEGVYSQDGEGKPYRTNVIIFGRDPFRVDNIGFWLSGHEPGNYGLFHIGIERKMSDVLDPHDIPLYVWKDGRATPITLDSLQRTPMNTYYLQRDYNGQNEPRFHLCNEPFDYSAWKRGKKIGSAKPFIENLGLDNGGKVNLSLTFPEKEEVCVTIINSRGEVLGKLYEGDMDAGVHHVVWDNFNSPGLYTVYVKGMGWDTEREMPIYPS